jgi:hypothetical protein
MSFKHKVILVIRDSRSYRRIFAWELNGTKVLTREPMFGKYLPFNNNTSISKKEVFCR